MKLNTKTNSIMPQVRIAVAALALIAGVAHAADFGAFELSGFLKEEWSICDNCSAGFVNPSGYDPRGVLTNPPNPPVNLAESPERRSANLGLAMLTGGYHYEFDNATVFEARASGRERNNKADIYGQYLIDGYIGLNHPSYGSIQIGTMSTRSWSRADSFSYPVGLSTSWAESGAGYSVVPRAIRLATKQFALPIGKIRFETTVGTASKQNPLNASSSVVAPTQ